MTGAGWLERFMSVMASRRRVVPVHILTSLMSSVAEDARAERRVTAYGLVDAGLSYVSNAAASGGRSPLLRYADGVARGNRWGLRGMHKLGNALSATFVLERGFGTSGGESSQSSALARIAYLGVSMRGIGALTFGRQTALSALYVGSNYTMGSQSAAGNYAYHINDIDQLASGRVSNAVKISITKFYRLEIGGMAAFTNRTEAASDAGHDVLSNAYSVGLNYISESFAMGAAYTGIHFLSGPTAPLPSITVANVRVGDLRHLGTYAVGARCIIGAMRVWANVTRTTLAPRAGAASKLDNLEIGGRYALTAVFGLALGYTRSTLVGASSGRWNQVNVALDYAMSKRMAVYAVAIRQMASGSNTVAGVEVPVQAGIGSSPRVIGDPGGGANSQMVLRIGVLHRF